MIEPTIDELKAIVGFAVSHAAKQKNAGMIDLTCKADIWLHALAKMEPVDVISLAHDVLTEHASTPYPIERTLVLSTSHLSQATAELMSNQLAHPKSAPQTISCDDHHGYGFWVYVASDDQNENEQDYPEDLKTVLATARAQGCSWVLFDQDADKLEDLPEFDG